MHNTHEVILIKVAGPVTSHTENAAIEWRIPIAQGVIKDVTLRGEVFHSGTVTLDYYAACRDFIVVAGGRSIVDVRQ
jgi:hypothetical protein